MKNAVNIFLVVVILFATAFALTKYRQIAIVSSTIDSTTIGATTPSSAVVTQFTVNTGIANSGTGFKTVRATSCTTPATAGGFCTSTINWPGAAFADTNYTMGCTGIGSGGVQFLVASSLSTTGFVAEAVNTPGNSAAATVLLHCWAIHD